MAEATLTRPAAAASAPTTELVRAPLAALTLATTPAIDVYSSTLDAGPTLLWGASSRLADDRLAEMRRSFGQYSFWVGRNDFGRVVDGVQRAWPEAADNRQLSPCERFALWELTYALELQATLRLMKCEPHVDAARRIGVQIAKIFSDESVDSVELHYAIHLSTSTPFRGMNLAGYTLQLARLMGETDRDSFEQIAVGALVHDLGARQLPVDPAAQNNKWNAEERELVERHPQRSFEELLSSKLSHGQMMMAYQHHERSDGEGYPVGIPGGEIHPWAKMLAIADRFEALTTGRAYRRPLELEGAAGQLEQDIKGHLDPEMTQCWIKSLQPS